VKYFIFSFVLFYCHCTFAQRYELGLNIGTSNYFGDLSPRLAVKNTREAIGIFAKKNISKYWSFRLNYTHARIAAADSSFKYNKLRNLSFVNNVNEFSGIFEFNYQPYALGILANKSTFYVLFGAAFLLHNPTASYQDLTLNLRELKTEGQSVPCSKFAIAVPMGIGYKWDVSTTFILSVELGFRWAFTDYLADVSTTYPDLNGKLPIVAHMSDRSVEKNDFPLSTIKKQRGDANPFDWYTISAVHFAYRFKPSSCYHF